MIYYVVQFMAWQVQLKIQQVEEILWLLFAIRCWLPLLPFHVKQWNAWAIQHQKMCYCLAKKSSKSTQKFHIFVQSKVKSSVKIFIDLYLIVDVLNLQLVYCPILIKIVSIVDLVCLFLHHFKRYFRVFVLFPTNV